MTAHGKTGALPCARLTHFFSGRMDGVVGFTRGGCGPHPVAQPSTKSKRVQLAHFLNGRFLMAGPENGQRLTPCEPDSSRQAAHPLSLPHDLAQSPWMGMFWQILLRDEREWVREQHSDRHHGLKVLPTIRKFVSGLVAEWLRNGLQIRLPRFDSGRGLQTRKPSPKQTRKHMFEWCFGASAAQRALL